MGTDHNISSVAGGNIGDVASQSSQDIQDREHHLQTRVSGNKEREGLRASQSFDESV
jgi:hypothetical protein